MYMYVCRYHSKAILAVKNCIHITGFNLKMSDLIAGKCFTYVTCFVSDF